MSTPVVLINAFTVPVEESERFLERWRDNARAMARRRPDAATVGDHEVGTMMAVRAQSRDGPDHLVYERAPVPGPGEALVAFHAAAVRFAELTWEESWTRDGVDRTPVVPSHEVAALGDGVTDLAAGDGVYGLIAFDRDGAAAEYVTVPAADLASKRRTASHVELPRCRSRP